MNNRKARQIFHALGLMALATVATLWAWNTLAELFGLPPAHYRHVLAAFCLLAILPRILAPGRGGRHRDAGVSGGPASR